MINGSSQFQMPFGKVYRCILISAIDDSRSIQTIDSYKKGAFPLKIDVICIKMYEEKRNLDQLSPRDEYIRMMVIQYCRDCYCLSRQDLKCVKGEIYLLPI